MPRREKCIIDINQWSADNVLKLNDFRAQFPVCNVQICNSFGGNRPERSANECVCKYHLSFRLLCFISDWTDSKIS